MVKPDFYTKMILTIIAFCLVVLVVDKISIVPSAFAHNLAGVAPPISTSYGLVPINKDGSVTVKLQSDGVVDVRLRGIDESPSLRWEAIHVKSE